MKRPIIIAHRGASGLAPENSLSSIRKAVEVGAGMVEIDLHRSYDGHLVVIHDEDLLRTAKVSGRVAEKTLEELKSLDVGRWFDESFAGERIPTLSEVLSATRGKIDLDVELKCETAALAGLAEKFVEEVSGAGMYEEILVSSFQWDVLRSVRTLDRSIRIGLLCRTWKGALEEAERLQASALIVSRRTARPEMVRASQANGCSFYVYTVNEPEEMVRWMEAGVDGICTDFPDRLNSLLRDLLPLC